MLFRFLTISLLTSVLVLSLMSTPSTAASQPFEKPHGKIVFTPALNPARGATVSSGECYSDNYVDGMWSCTSSEPLVLFHSQPDTIVDFVMYNNCLLPNSFTLTIDYIDGDGWVVPAFVSGIIPAEGQFANDLTFSIPAGAEAGTSWECTISIHHEADDSLRVIPVCLIVGHEDYWPLLSVLATTCKQLVVNSHGGSGLDTPNQSLDYIDDCDTFTSETDPKIYLYDGVPLVSRIDGNDTLLSHLSGFEYVPKDSYRAIKEPEIDSISDPSMVVVTTEFVTAGQSIGCILSYYVPTAPDTCEGIVQKFRFYNNTDETLNNVALGCFFDWDVPSDSINRNTSGFDLANGVIYQQGYEYDDTTNGDCGQLEDDRFAGIMTFQMPQNAMTLDNATWTFTSGPFGPEAPLPAGPVYELMRGSEGYSLYNSSSPDSVAVDLSTLITYGVYDISVSDTIDILQVISTGKSGLSDFLAEMEKTYQWAENHEVYVNPSCCILPGDVNHDGEVNLGDAVYLIDYIFRGGPPPPCMAEADVNIDGAVNIGDVVFLINYIFKGGQPPECGSID
ncbi:MAG: dockerin type I repeat-containing protein [candidate division Zixibacteria bacterium]|nr:dockerin type I repeat-containing protein [candidate division Zixibacteria bacterium]